MLKRVRCTLWGAFGFLELEFGFVWNCFGINSDSDCLLYFDSCKNENELVQHLHMEIKSDKVIWLIMNWSAVAMHKGSTRHTTAALQKTAQNHSPIDKRDVCNLNCKDTQRDLVSTKKNWEIGSSGSRNWDGGCQETWNLCGCHQRLKLYDLFLQDPGGAWFLRPLDPLLEFCTQMFVARGLWEGGSC